MNIIFDFDGTIVDSFDYVLGFLSDEAKKEKPTGKAARRFRGQSMKHMALMLDIPYWRLPFLYFKGRRVMRAQMDNLRAFNGMEEVITELSEQGHKVYIVSSNSGRNIRRFLIKSSLNQHIQAVKGSAGLFGKDNIIRQLKYRYRMKEEIWYVGDELADIRAAKVAKIKIAAVTWGFANREELIAKEPDFLAITPRDLLSLPSLEGNFK